MSGVGSEEPFSNISDTSFVILGPSSLPNQGSDEGLHENSNPESCISSKSANTCLDLNKLGSIDSKYISKCSSSEESIQRKLNELVKENYHLKETLSQNNLAMKSQLHTFFMWQQEVLKSHETHNEKFLETKDLILKLRMENLSLKKQLEESAHGFSILSVSDSSGQTDRKFGNTDVLKERIEEFENICSELASKNANLEIEKQKLVEELGGVKNEVTRLKKELEEVTVENLFLKQRTENFQKNSNESNSYKSLPNSEARAQISNLFKQLEEEKSKVSKLREALKESKSRNAETSVSEGCSSYEPTDRVCDANHSLDMQSQGFGGFQSWITIAKGNLKENQRDEQVDCNLESEMKGFKSYLNLEESASKEKQESVEELKKQFTKLLEDYKTLQQQFNSLHGESQNIEKYKEQIAHLSTELQTKDKELISEQQECSDLKEEIKKLNLEWEEKVSVLQIQADLYRSDFNSEREARELLIREKEELAEQVIFLQNRIEELEKSQGNCLNERSNLASSGKKTSYKCPKCLISFTNLRNLEDHVDDCLDTFMYP